MQDSQKNAPISGKKEIVFSKIKLKFENFEASIITLLVKKQKSAGGWLMDVQLHADAYVRFPLYYVK